MLAVFSRFARWVARITARPGAFILSALIIVAWAISGPLFHFSDTWQLIINTGTGLVTFLMVFLIQNTQNRDSTAIHIKLDELLRSVKGAHTALTSLEQATQEDLDQLKSRYQEIARQAREELAQGRTDIDSPTVSMNLPKEERR